MNTTVSLDGIAELPDLGVIQVTGEDARKFLHAQLTQDFLLLPAGQARLAAFCSAKGRMLASFIAVPHGAADVLLVCQRDLLAPTLKRLAMFVLRAKARLVDASEAFVLRGLAGASLAQLLGDAESPWRCRPLAGGGLAVTLYPADGVTRALWIAPTGTALPPVECVLSTDAWRWSELRSGVATVSAATVDAFVPQMLNYESIGGVNFKKGCYPGQEIVARSQFRGTLKRRARLAQATTAMQAGQEIFRADDAGQPCATVVQAASAPGGGYEAIVSGQIAALDAGDLRLGAADGPALTITPAPYPLLEDI